MDENKVIVITAPSGAGKSTIVKYLLKQFRRLSLSISATSRNPRGKEKNGLEYYFLSVNAFKQKIKNNELFEWEEVYPGSFYGTLKAELDRLFKLNKIVIFDVDVLGAMNIKKKFKNNALTIFIKPPSILALKKRLEKRHTDSAESINNRLIRAKKELKLANKFDKIIVNDDLKKACLEIKDIVKEYINN